MGKTIANGTFELVGTSGSSPILHRGQWIDLLVVTEAEAQVLMNTGCQYLRPLRQAQGPQADADSTVSEPVELTPQQIKALSNPNLKKLAEQKGIDITGLKRNEIVEKVLSF